MPYLSSDLCNQTFSYDPAFYQSGEDKDTYPESVSDEIFCGSELPCLRKEGFDLEREVVLDYQFIGDELSYNRDEEAISKNDYFNTFWGENWLFSLRGSCNCSYIGEMPKPETPHPDEELGIWLNHNNIEMPDYIEYELPREDGLKNDFFNVYTRNDESYGCIADEGPSEWAGGLKLEGDGLSSGPSGYGEATVAFNLASQ